MKKLLSLLLAASMTFGIGAVGVSAYEIPENIPTGLLIAPNPMSNPAALLTANEDLMNALGEEFGMTADEFKALVTDAVSTIMQTAPAMIASLDLKNITPEQIAGLVSQFTGKQPVEAPAEEGPAEEGPAADPVAFVGKAINVFAVPENAKLLVLGDSNATGYGLEAFSYDALETPIEGSFAEIAAEGLLHNGETAAMFAMPGATSENVLDLFTNDEDGVVAAAVAQMDTIIINVGGNDYIAALLRVPAIQKLMNTLVSGGSMGSIFTSVVAAAENPAELMVSIQSAANQTCISLTENLNAIVAAIRALNPDVKIVVVNVPNVLAIAETPMAQAVLGIAAAPIAKLGAAVSSDFEWDDGANVIEISAEGASFQADGIHFAPQTHEIIAARIVDAVNAQLKAEHDELVRKMIFALLVGVDTGMQRRK